MEIHHAATPRNVIARAARAHRRQDSQHAHTAKAANAAAKMVRTLADGRFEKWMASAAHAIRTTRARNHSPAASQPSGRDASLWRHDGVCSAPEAVDLPVAARIVTPGVPPEPRHR